MSIDFIRPEVDELRPRISVIGVGGAGGNAIANMIASDVQGVDFVVANTDAQALNASTADRRIQLGLKITQGLGAGSRPEIGRAAAEETLEEIERALEGAHMCFIAAGMGGGTGTGAAPVIAKAARDGHPDRRRRDQAVRVRRRAPRPLGRRRHRRAAAARRHADRHSQPESVPPRQFGNDLQGSVRNGRRGAPAGRPRDHRPDGHARPDQPRLRRRPLGDGRDGQGDDGHRRGVGRQSRDRGRREGDLQPAARRRQHEGRQGRDHLDHRRRGHAPDGSRRGRQPHQGTGRPRRQHHLGLGVQQRPGGKIRVSVVATGIEAEPRRSRSRARCSPSRPTATSWCSTATTS
jgi:hypothetical protein